MKPKKINSIGVLTSGGDSQGMNAALRAVVKTALYRGVEVYAFYQGYQGMVEGGDMIRKMDWDSVGGILHKGGTVIGTARSKDFRERSGRLRAAKNLLLRSIDNLVVIGGDGSLSGADELRAEWPSLLKELLDSKEITPEQAQRCPEITIVGLVGSIDNDLSGTDMTIGADTALKRITEAVDAISSTAASHQRTFVVEVMGRNCGYLALMSALACGADYVFIPEDPPAAESWGRELCEAIQENRKTGKKKSLIIIAEGAIDRDGNPIRSYDVVDLLKNQIGEDARLTILGHVQRGGSPTAFDRYMSTVLGYAAVEYLIERKDKESKIIGLQKNRVTPVDMMESIRRTRSIAGFIKSKDFDQAIELRGGSFRENLKTFHTLAQSRPRPLRSDDKHLTLLVMNAGGPAPGMNSAVRTAVRLGLDKGHKVLGVKNGFEGLIKNQIQEMDWIEVEDWSSQGGSILGTNRRLPDHRDYYAVAKNLEDHGVDAMLIIGGYTAYNTAYNLYNKRSEFAAFEIPIVCLPASINNSLPATDFSVGADTALNNIVEAVDKIKESAVASRRAFVVEVMGRRCGYLAMMSGLATGAERVYTHEDGITLADLQRDVKLLVDGFKAGKRLGLVIRNENANRIYDTTFLCKLYEQEGGDLFDVRQSILGHLQQGGKPSPYDRIIATRMAANSVDYLIKRALKKEATVAAVGLQGGHLSFKPLDELPKMIEVEHARPKEQWWMGLKIISEVFERFSA
jgi:6-phosphofructokinase 1